MGKFGKGVIQKNKMHKEIQNNMKGIPSLFRNFRVAVTNKGKVLNFDKLNSGIIKSGERNNLQKMFDTINNQKDFSPVGTQAVAHRLSKFTKFGDINETSALATSMSNAYSSAIKKIYPDLHNIRSKFSADKKMINGIDEVLKSTKSEVANPTTVTGVAKKLSNLFQEDNDAYLRAIIRLENKTGVSLLKELAATEFTRVAPASFGSKVAEIGLLAGGIAYNPLILLALPLFSPKVSGKLIMSTGRNVSKFVGLGKYLPKIERAIPPLLNFNSQTSTPSTSRSLKFPKQ